MKERRISSTEFQREIGAICEEARDGGTVIVLRHARRYVVILSPERYERLCEAERQMAARDTE